jgi:transcriptional regulator with XRE-family HTH domain
MIKFGNTIRRLREDADISLKEMSRRAGVTYTYFSALENDRVEPSLALIRKIARVLGVYPEVLIWEATEIPANLSKQDRRICKLAKLIVREHLTKKDLRRN